MSTGKRLVFDRELVRKTTTPPAGLSRPPEPAGKNKVWKYGEIALFTLIATSMVSGGIYGVLTYLPFRNADEKAIRYTATTLLTAFKANQMDTAALLFQPDKMDEPAASKPAAQNAGDSPEVKAIKENVTLIRAELETMGVDWNDIAPAAFGGIRCGINAAEKDKPSENMAIGAIYFTSKQKLFAVEFSGYMNKRHFIISTIWKYNTIPVALDKLAQYNKEQYSDSANAAAGDDKKIANPHLMFFKL